MLKDLTKEITNALKSDLVKNIKSKINDQLNMFSSTGSLFTAGVLQIEGNSKTYKVLEYGYEIRQQVKDNGEPASGIGIGLIKVLIYSPGDDDLFFYEWMKNRNEVKNGVIVLSEPKERPTKTIMFNKAYCVGIADTFEKECANTRLTISAIEVSFSDDNRSVSFQNNIGIVKDDKFYLKQESGGSAAVATTSAAPASAASAVISANKKEDSKL